jgi:hypothetical protein
MTVERPIGILEACDDPQIFNVKLCPLQRVILAAIERGPRIATLALGRRSGKSFLMALVLLYFCVCRPDLARFTRPGERRYAVGIATNLRQARLLVSAARAVCENSRLLSSMVEEYTLDEIRFKNGTALTAFPCNSRGGRGWPIVCLCMDESAWFVSESTGYQAADEIWQALAPSTAQFADEGRIIVSSTPAGPSGFFYDLHTRATNGEIADAQAHHYTTAEVNPTITPEFLAAERARDPDGYLSEYEASFTSGGSGFINFDLFAPPEREHDVLPGQLVQPIVCGVDAAFAGHDLHALCVTGRDPDEPRRLVVAHLDAMLPRRAASFEERAEVQRELLDHTIEVCKRYSAGAVIDQFAAQQVKHAFAVHGVPCAMISMTAASKSAAYNEVRSRLYTGEVDLPNDPELLADLRRLRTRISAGGASVVTPRIRGNHGDRGQALAISVLRQAQHGAMVASEDSPSGGPLGLPIMSGLGSPDAMTAGELLALEREKPNLRGRQGADPDRPGVSFGRRGRGIFSPNTQW